MNKLDIADRRRKTGLVPPAFGEGEGQTVELPEGYDERRQRLTKLVSHWKAKGTKRGRHFARHYQWMLNRLTERRQA